MTSTSNNQVHNNGAVAELSSQTETFNFNREPPPSYTDIELPVVPVTQIITVPWQNRPMHYNCIVCRERIVTRVEYVNTRKTHMLAGFICGLTCWCMLCCLGALPYIIPTFKKAKHYCPNCNTFLGECKKYD